MRSSIDLARILRRRKPEKRHGQINPRAVGELTSVGDLTSAGRIVLVPDTNVYIGEARGDLTSDVEALLDRALLFHCVVCLSELATGVANGDPSHPRWPETREHYEELIKVIPPSRLLTPDPEVWAEAGVVAGILARTQGYVPHRRKESLNDALIFLTASKAGVPVLTANRHDFDLIQQIVPEGHFVCC